MRRALACLAFAVSSPFAWAQSSEIANPDPMVESRLKVISEELRCLVCQNQTIADSHAPLAVDLRTQIRGMIASGKSDEEIRGYMVERYGDFVLYRPPFKATTLVLWVAPAVLIFGGLGSLLVLLRRRRGTVDAEAPTDPAKRREIEQLLDAGNRPAGADAKGSNGRP
jgi:cytochrome c-type biogenesis protein CcmH